MRIVSRPTCGASFRLTASVATNRTLHRAMPSGGEPHTMAMIRWLWPTSSVRCFPGLGFSYSADSSPAPHNAGRLLSPFSPPHPHWPPPAPPSDQCRAGAESKHAAKHTPIPAPWSASQHAAADPSFPTGHAPDDSFACLHYAAIPLVQEVTEKVHHYTVKDLV